MILKYIGLYLSNIISALDRLINALLGGDYRETLSSRMGKHLPGCRLCLFICRLLNRIDPNHCIKYEDQTVGDKAV